MTKTTQAIAAYLLLFSIIVSGCGPGQVLGPTITPIPASTATPEPTATPVFGIGSTMTREKDGMVMVYVPAGPFQKGDDNNQAISHTESLDAFWIDQTEVTNAMFQAFVQVTKYKTDAEKIGKGMLVIPDLMKYETIPGVNWMHPQGPISNLLGLNDHPVVNVSWGDATMYCIWAMARLPTDSEWEKAARGTDGRKYPWGNEAPNGKLANYADANLTTVNWADQSTDDGYKFTAPVGSYPQGASPYGALDMARNVAEVVGDDWDNAAPVNVSYSKTIKEVYRMIRGGSWYSHSSTLQSDVHMLLIHSYEELNTFGFRCARSP